MSSAHPTFTQGHCIAMGEAFTASCIVDRQRGWLGRDHVRPRYSSRSPLHHFGSEVRGLFKFILLSPKGILPMTLPALDFFKVGHYEVMVLESDIQRLTIKSMHSITILLHIHSTKPRTEEWDNPSFFHRPNPSSWAVLGDGSNVPCNVSGDYVLPEFLKERIGPGLVA